jgi:transposase
VDETTLSLNYPLRSCWMKRGQQKAIPAFTGKRDYLHVIGAYNWASAQLSHLTVERKNSDTFIAFVEQLATEYPTQSLILVMDHASYHHSAKVQAMLSLLEHRLQVFWLPQYCPELNVIERFWLHLKQTVAANQLYRSIADLQQQVLHLFSQQNDIFGSERLLFHHFFQ